MERYLNQAIDWSGCRAGSVHAECAEIAVPLDYADPDGQAITLALLRRPAADGTTNHPLFLNPGGPGVPGRTLAAYLDNTVLPSYELVGWDPRGTGGSTPVVCGVDLDALRAVDASPDDPAEDEALVAAWRGFGESCAAGSGRLLEHISTADTVADLELLRALLGGPRLDYLGYSYGTEIGAVYAETYPQNVGHMTLDSPVNITDKAGVVQANGFELAFEAFAEWCATTPDCGLGTDADAIVADTVAFLDRLDQEPVPVGDRFLTQSIAHDGLAQYLYDDATAYPDLAADLGAAQAGDGAALLDSADHYWGRDPDGTYENSITAFNAIRCADGWDDGVQAAFDRWREATEHSPVFAGFSGPDVVCPVWPVRPATDEEALQIENVAPILVVGATGDSATPYVYAEWMAEAIPGARLLTYDGAGHGTYGGRNECVDSAVEAYFNEGTLPAEGTTCS
jgi:pimeloyl-ACP methyl ester carboxylesterase